MTRIQQQVMASVAIIYALRQLTSSLALKVYGLTLSVVGIVAFVSLSNVLSNLALVAQGGVFNVGTFVLSAVLGTTLVVQMALVVGAITLGLLLVDAVRSLARVEGRFA